ncbi:MAG: DUF421 domain-containing protein [Cyclobacteriaceae bacterium]|nr:DUF421 domain-containing protein [Cyclobacteriaceae bacterium]
MNNVFFDNWESLGRTFIVTISAYLVLIFLLRASGKSTLSKMTAFDFIVTIALGSTLATVALNKNVALADGVLAFFLLIFLQFIITWLSVRENKIKKIVTSQPTLLLFKGKLIGNNLKRERITTEEIYVAARERGITELKDIDAIVFETTGELTIIPKIPTGTAETLKDVKNYL